MAVDARWQGWRVALCRAALALGAALCLGAAALADSPCDPITPSETLKPVVTIDQTSVWRPRGGEVKFTLNGPGVSNVSQVVACYKWSNNRSASNPYRQAAVQLVDASKTPDLVYSATVPDLPAAPRDIWSFVFGHFGDGDSTALGLVPLADFRVIVVTGTGATAQRAEVVQQVGVTYPLVAAIVTAGVVLIAWSLLYLFGRQRGVPGGGKGDAILRLISTKAGYASLSQLQIILWSFLVGGSAVYVMALSGNLIDITGGTLVLLGISGAATVGSKFQSVSADKTSTDPPNPPTPPGQVVALRTTVVGPDEIGLAWGRPSAGGQAETYSVRYQPAGGDWTTFTTTLSRPGVIVSGLTPHLAHTFEVRAVNGGGPGDPATTQATTQNWPAGAAAPVAPRLDDEPANTSITLAWDAVANAADRYRVEWRARDSNGAWRRLQPDGRTKPSAKVAGLSANAVYDFRVARAVAPQNGGAPVYGQWAIVTAATVGPRVPFWSDLVIEADGADEIEVTRVQMLFFTVIVALFVAMRVATSGEIPVIPEGYLLLMGISNGVYLTAKFVN
jgi:hypothetical protein